MVDPARPIRITDKKKVEDRKNHSFRVIVHQTIFTNYLSTPLKSFLDIIDMSVFLSFKVSQVSLNITFQFDALPDRLIVIAGIRHGPRTRQGQQVRFGEERKSKKNVLGEMVGHDGFHPGFSLSFQKSTFSRIVIEIE